MTGIRWTAQKKWAVITTVKLYPERKEAIMAKHEISAEEFAAWERDYAAAGVPGLRIKSLQITHPERRPT